MDLTRIEELTKSYKDQRQQLSEIVYELQSRIEELQEKYYSAIKESARYTKQAREKLLKEITAHPELFQDKKTYIFHGIQVGYRKQKGSFVWDDDNKVIELIKKYYPEEWQNFIRTEESILKRSLEQLDAKELKKLGISIVNDQDIPVIKEVDKELDTFVDNLLKKFENNKESKNG